MSSRYVVLSPRSHLAYGQDFTRQLTHVALGIVPLEAATAKETDFSSVDLVLVHDLENADVAAAVQLLPAHLPIVAHLHLQWSYCDKKLQDNLIASLGRIHDAIAPAAFLATDLAARFPHTRWTSVRNGVDESRFRPAVSVERMTWRKSAGVPDNAMLLAYVGRLESAKGLQVLRAIARQLGGTRYHLLLQYPAWAGLARGFEAAAHDIKQTCPDHVHLVPDTDPSGERPIRFCDCLVHPSLSEVAPRTVIESWMAGVPVVATTCTPFFDEVPELACATCLVSLPPELGLESLDRAFLRIDDPSVSSSIARELLDRVEPVVTASDEDRADIARRARACGFSAGDMIEGLRRIYEKVVARVAQEE